MPGDAKAGQRGISLAALASLVVLGVTVPIANRARGGGFRGGLSGCGDWNFTCLGDFLLVYAIGCGIGLILALVAFASTGPRKLLNWSVLLLSIGPPLYLVIQIAMA
ncbi:hypothetical protein OU994_20635 [Pseudoduganella sp. SL102]|uniref:hypothetical protein n=1 Tax=Pseudoduganella sp. SL102 TaxID=2995154 RepID=UPI00248CB4AB|nr:hypothetical protein [Pseudoduganella sp. SL102]WBS00707.1 hypothetical protein OU994_20635 [Pseudoduganella sp. SL102]